MAIAQERTVIAVPAKTMGAHRAFARRALGAIEPVAGKPAVWAI